MAHNLAHLLFTCLPHIDANCVHSSSDAPQVNLSLGKALEEDKIVEGDDIYFDCDVVANPEATNIRWFRKVNS